jgi:chaperonin GroES
MKKLSVTVLHDRLIVEPEQAMDKTSGGIIIPDTAKEKPHRGVVVAAGGGTKGEPMTVKEGDVVLYSKHSGSEIEINDVSYLIMKESEVLAILNDEK